MGCAACQASATPMACCSTWAKKQGHGECGKTQQDGRCAGGQHQAKRCLVLALAFLHEDVLQRAFLDDGRCGHNYSALVDAEHDRKVNELPLPKQPRGVPQVHDQVGRPFGRVDHRADEPHRSLADHVAVRSDAPPHSHLGAPHRADPVEKPLGQLALNLHGCKITDGQYRHAGAHALPGDGAAADDHPVDH